MWFPCTCSLLSSCAAFSHSKPAGVGGLSTGAARACWVLSFPASGLSMLVMCCSDVRSASYSAACTGHCGWLPSLAAHQNFLLC